MTARSLFWPRRGCGLKNGFPLRLSTGQFDARICLINSKLGCRPPPELWCRFLPGNTKHTPVGRKKLTMFSTSVLNQQDKEVCQISAKFIKITQNNSPLGHSAQNYNRKSAPRSFARKGRKCTSRGDNTMTYFVCGYFTDPIIHGYR